MKKLGLSSFTGIRYVIGMYVARMWKRWKCKCAFQGNLECPQVHTIFSSLMSSSLHAMNCTVICNCIFDALLVELNFLLRFVYVFDPICEVNRTVTISTKYISS